MANRNWIIIAIAAIIGIVAVILANSYLTGVENQQERSAEENRMVQVAVARVPMAYGTALTAENIRMVAWPVTSLPPGAFQSTRALLGVEQRVVLRPIEAGEPILPGKVTGPGGRASISALIDEDMRAVAVRISDVSGVAGFVLPNDTVDVLLTRTPKTESEGQIDPITDVLLQNVRVIAIDQGADDKNNQPVVGKTATLLVDQQGAQKLALASNVGSLSLALRNAANQDVFMAQTVGTRDLGQGSVSPSFYNQPRSGTAAMASSPYPIPAMQAAAIGQARNAAGPVRRKPANSVEVEIVRGTASSSYDVSRHRGY
ncbi:Flp pilus assembly protein CpaB [Sphingorhabdus sp.]|uniref:Flp pilus assembly protein CpaB n=1 Tax=Sphingorhabdus sp. TaxID=1902408 RepID=UPI0032B82601